MLVLGDQSSSWSTFSPRPHPSFSPGQNGVLAGVYPASPSSWLIVVILMMSSLYTCLDPSLGMIDTIKENLPHRSDSRSICSSSFCSAPACLGSTPLGLEALPLGGS